MGSGLKKLAYGLGAGLQTFGHEYGKALDKEQAMEQQKFENQMAKDRLSETQKMNTNLLKMRDMQMSQMEFQNNVKKAQYNHSKIAEGIAAGGYHPKFSTPLLTQYHPSKIAYRYNEAESTPDKYVIEKGHYKLKADGKTPEIDPETGDKIWVPLPGLARKREYTPEQWVAEVNKLQDVTHGIAMQQKKDILQLQLNNYKQKHEWLVQNDQDYKNRWYETEAGKREKEYEELRNQKMQKEIDAVGKSKTAGKGAVYKDADGNKVELTSQEVETAKANRRAMEEQGYEGIRVQEAWRIGKVKDDPIQMRALDRGLKKVLREEESDASFLKMHKEMGVPRKFLQDMLDDAKENPELYLDDSEGMGVSKEGSSKGLTGWFSNFFSSMNPDVGVNEGAGAMF